ncbi:MAG: LysR substrate-binding domain-containing protein [Geminicoccales bacterium]
MKQKLEFSFCVSAFLGWRHCQRILAASKFMVRNITSLLALVRAGVGVTVLPRLAIDQASAKLRFLPVADETAIRRIDILSAAHIAPSPATQVFEDTIRRTARVMPRHHLPLFGHTKGVLCCALVIWRRRPHRSDQRREADRPAPSFHE